MAGEGIGDVVQLLVWEVNEIERVEVEKEPKDWAVGDEVSCSTCLSTYFFTVMHILLLLL